MSGMIICVVPGGCNRSHGMCEKSGHCCERAKQRITPDPIVESVRAKLLQRSQVGVMKYGVTLEGAHLNTLQVLIHAQEEAMDLANYLEVEIQRLTAEARRRL